MPNTPQVYASEVDNVFDVGANPGIAHSSTKRGQACGLHRMTHSRSFMLSKFKKLLGFDKEIQPEKRGSAALLIQNKSSGEYRAPEPSPLQEADSLSRLSSRSKELNRLFHAWLSGVFPAEVKKSELLIEEQILAEAEKLSSSQGQVGHLIRRMPGIIPRLLQQLRHENYSGVDVAKKISSDVTLLAAVIRLANSVQYNCKHQITSMQQAIHLIGQDGLRQVITIIALQPIVNSHSGPLFRTAAPRLWEQAEKCAIANRFLASENGINHFPAFLSGLIKNVGLSILLRVTDARLLKNQHIGTTEFWDAMNFHSSILTSRIAQEWHFPDEVIIAIDETKHRTSTHYRSSLGALLEHGDLISKLQILTENDVPGIEDINASLSMKEKEYMCMHEMYAKNECSP